MRRFKVHTAPDLNLVILDRTNPDDREIIREYRSEIFKILQDGYAGIGGCEIYQSPKHMYNSVSRYKLVVDDSFNIYACAVYRLLQPDNSYKCILISENRKLCTRNHRAIQTIIKSDIVNFKKLYWIEASGPIAHWEEKYGAVKIPNVYIPAILTNRDDITLNPDGFSYTRGFTKYNTPITKTMFGFSSKELLNKVIQDSYMDKYEELLVNVIGKDEAACLYENFDHTPITRWYTLYKTMLLLEDRYNFSNMFHNITPVIKVMLRKMLAECQEIKSKVPEKYQEEFIISIDETELILESANVIRPHRLF